MAALSYMQRRTSGIYEFRRRLPKPLAGQPVPVHLRAYLSELVNSETGRFKGELTISLQTTDGRAAKQRDMREAVRVGELFTTAEKLYRGGTLPDGAHPPKLSPEEIEAEIVAGLLRRDEEEREAGDARRYEQTPEQRAQWPDLEPAGFGTLGMVEVHWELLDGQVRELREEYRKALAMRRPDIVKAELHGYLKEKSVPIDPTSPFYREAGLAVLRGHVKAYEMMVKRQEGEDVPTPDPSPSKGPKLSEAYAKWKGERKVRGSRTPSPKTIREADRSVRLFLQWHGDLRLGDITKEKARDFRNAIARVPRGLNKEERGLSLRQLLTRKLADRPAAHAGTVNKHVTLLGAVVSVAEAEGMVDALPGFANPFRKLTLELDERNDGGEKVFSAEHFKAIFGADIYTEDARPLGGAGEAAYWLPLLAALCGARQGELAQLRIKDIRHEDTADIWYISINAEGSRTIKNAGSRREVPLHPELIRLGILNYRQSLSDDGADDGKPLWPDMKSGDKLNAASAWSKWFNRTLRTKIGLSEEGYVFHTFRHTFKRLCRNAGIAEEVHDALTGHAGGGGVGRTYGKGFALEALHAAVSKVQVPKAIRGLKSWNGVEERPTVGTPGANRTATIDARGFTVWGGGPASGSSLTATAWGPGGGSREKGKEEG